MTDYVWKKAGQGAGPDEQVMDFLAGDDVRLDRELLFFDIMASAAHANGLQEIGILDSDENQAIQAALPAVAQGSPNKKARTSDADGANGTASEPTEG